MGAAASAQRAHSAVVQARIVAPISGTIISRTIEPAETVIVGAPLLVIADLSRLEVEAEVDELDALRVTPRMRAKISVDGSEATFAGTVESIGSAVVPRGLRPNDPARPTDTQVLKVRLRLEAPPATLKLGQRLDVTLLPGVEEAP
jgi:multidrug resistance efflux pump